MIRELLGKIGFKYKEILVYTAIVSAGRASASVITKATGLNRATVYSVAKILCKRGVVYEDASRRPREFYPSPLEDLKRLTSPLKREVEKKDQLISEAISELNNISTSTRYSVPKIRLVEHEQLRDFLFKQTAHWYKSLTDSKESWWGFQDHRLVEEYQDWIDYSWKKYPKQEVKLLSNDSRIEAQAKSRYPKTRQIRFWRESQNFTATTWIVGDYIILIHNRGQFDYLLEINDPVLAHNLREVFRGIWNGLPKS